MFFVKLKQTFSFNKLIKKFDTIIEETEKDMRDNTVLKLRQNIDKQSNYREAFAPLSPNTVKRRLRKGHTHVPIEKNILKDSGKLYNSIRRVGRNKITAEGYGLKHAYGTRNMPMRDWTLIDESKVLSKKRRKILFSRIAKAWRSKK